MSHRPEPPADTGSGAPRPARLLLPGSMSRRRFLAVAGGFALAGCTGTAAGDGSGVAGAVTTSTLPAPVAGPDAATDRVLVVVTLDGGNDAVNTLPPDLGSYTDLRPGLALAEADRIRHATLPGHGLHPALAGLVPLLDDGSLAVVAGVGFPDPDRSHFTSIDRWDRADRMAETTGWLGRWLDTVDGDVPALTATALGSAGHMSTGATRRPSVIDDVDAFGFPSGVGHGDVRALAGDATAPDPLVAAARRAFADAVGAVEEFDAIADAVRSGDGGDDRTSGPIANGLAVAAELIRAGRGTRVVTVTVGGFDTHSGQLGQHETLLTDLADGLGEFWEGLAAAGDRDRVLLLTTSEFGRRVGENGSGGTDHGSAGLSFLLGDRVVGGLHGTIDTDGTVDGDLAPVLDPRTLYTAALDHLEGDPEAVLGGRWDEVRLLA